jgi:hypothetical protein
VSNESFIFWFILLIVLVIVMDVVDPNGRLFQVESQDDEDDELGP